MLINELNPRIYRLWLYLQKATELEILMLPRLEKGQRISLVSNLKEEQRILLSLHARRGSSKTTADRVTSFGLGVNGEAGGVRSGGIKTFKFGLASKLNRIRHWSISCCDFRKLENVEATWFIDPPYQKIATKYETHTTIDYSRLAEWCRSRKGQVIVCEQSGADWLPFRRFHYNRAAAKKTYSMEMIWTNDT